MVKDRVYALDELRGLMLIAIVLYHLGYDLAVFTPLQMDWFWGGAVSLLRYIAAATLMVVSGVSCSLSRSNLRRGLRIFGLGLLITAASHLAMPEQMIVFGVLHYFGVMILLFWLARPLIEAIPPLWGGAACLLLFYLSYPIPSGYAQLLHLRLPLPSSLYDWGGLFWLGLPAQGFVSSDYYPLLPWGWLFLLGGFIGLYCKRHGFPRWSTQQRSQILSIIGKNTMLIYLVHQPLFLGLLYLLGGVF